MSMSMKYEARSMITLDGKIEGMLAAWSCTTYATVTGTLLCAKFPLFAFLPGKMMQYQATNVAMHSCDAATFLYSAKAPWSMNHCGSGFSKLHHS